MNAEGEIFGLALLVFFWTLAASEAFVHLSRGKSRRILAKDKVLAERCERWISDNRRYLLAIRILRLTALAMAVAVAAPWLAALLAGANPPSPWMLPLAVIAVCLPLVAAGELTARLWAPSQRLILLRVSTPVLRFLMLTILFPLVEGVMAMEGWLGLRRQSRHGDEDEGRDSTEDEIMSLVENESGENGGPSPLEEDERRMIRGIFDLDDTQVREVMTPRVDVVALSADTQISEAKREFVGSGHSRIPIFKETIDKITGILYAKDFLDEDKLRGKTLDQLAHQPIFIPETKEVGDLLEELKRNSNHFAVVIDEYGGTAGIVTLEDIIEEIVGEIRDEYDDEEEGEDNHEQLPDGSVQLDARTLIYDVNQLLRVELPEDEDVDTIGGLVCGELGRIPEAGERLVLKDNIEITVLEADPRRVQTIKIKVLPND